MKMVLNRMATKHSTVWPPLLPTSLYQPEKYCQCLKYNIKGRCNNKTNSPTKAVFSSWSSSWESKLPRCALLSPDPRPRLCWRQISLSWLGGYEKHCSYAMGTQKVNFWKFIEMSQFLAIPRASIWIFKYKTHFHWHASMRLIKASFVITSIQMANI